MKTVEHNLQAYIEQERMFHFEGDKGVERLETIVGVLGYTSFMGQSELLSFLSDNPGAQEALVTWIGKQCSEEWNTNLKSELTEDDSDEDDEVAAE
jgi:hypothetical protein